MRLLPLLLCFLLTSCATNQIVQDIQDRQIVAKTDALLVSSESTFSNLTEMTSMLNTQIPATLDRISVTLAAVQQLGTSLASNGNSIAQSFAGAEAAIQQTANGLAPAVSNLNLMTAGLNQQLPVTIAKIDALFDHSDVLVTNLNRIAVTTEKSLEAVNSRVSPWRMILIAIGIAIALGAIGFALILLRLLWVVTKSVDQAIPAPVRKDLGPVQQKEAPRTQKLLVHWLKWQRKIREVS